MTRRELAARNGLLQVQNEALATGNQQLRQLTRRMILAQENERKAICSQLHDEIVQTLAGINVELAALGQRSSTDLRHVKAKLGYTQRLVENSVTAVHRFSRQLRPAVLDDLGLIPALHALGKNLAERKRLKIRLTAFAGVESLAATKRTVLFRVAQEALANVARHARASLVKVTIRKISDTIRMEINDNGRSFSVKKTLLANDPGHLGLVGMRERLEMVGGHLAIESVPGIGTSVQADVPFTQDPCAP